ncbi:MAG TPA: dihydrolipoamide acetyltransferase family protein [Ktedonobacterales bacterium]|nr:dihydrolipoamide acetyltransferase family protein [Ktedonobacterales bacterium]
MHTVVMPKLGDTMEEGKILNWLIQEGEKVEKGDALAEIETEKVTIPVEAFAAGVLRKILVPAGETVPVGAPIAYTGAADEPLPTDAGAAPAKAASAPQPARTRTESQAEAAPAKTTPQPVEQPATEPRRQQAQPVASVANTQTRAEGGVTYAPAGNGHGAVTEQNGRTFISPIARRIAQEHHLDIAHIQGTGPGGRILREDVEAAIAQPQLAGLAPAGVGVSDGRPPAPVLAAQAGEDVEAVPLSNMRKTIARRLQQSMQTVPHFYVTVAIDATKLGAFRQQVNDYAASLPEPVKISVNDLIVKGVATALTHMPQVNVSFDGERLLLKKHINIGVAVALEQGLIVPVVRDADKRGVLDIARESRRLVDAARTGKLKPEEFQGGTFSVSNLGMYDVEEFTAIINPPESAILAIGAIVPTPVVRDGQVVVRDIMKVTLSVDHRALDGATAARFLQDLKRLLEEPLGMLL